MVALGEIAPLVRRPAIVDPEAFYTELGIRSFFRGPFARRSVQGSEFTWQKLFRVQEGDLVFSNIMAWEQAIARADKIHEGWIANHRMLTCAVDRGVADPGFLWYYLTTPDGFRGITAASPGTAARNKTLNPTALQELRVPLPPLPEQQRIAAKLDGLSMNASQLAEHWQAIERNVDALLAQEFADLIAAAPRRTLGEVAPLVRRPVDLQPGERYAEVGARSFGKGLFTKPDFDADAATWQKPVWIKAGDLVLSNIKAWEGAIAVAEDQHDGCIASHRYLTCVPDPTTASAAFLCYFLLSPQGLEAVGLASPGTADRNRTTNPKVLQAIPVPLPLLSKQKAFTDLRAKLNALRTAQTKQREQLDRLRQRALEEAFG